MYLRSGHLTSFKRLSILFFVVVLFITSSQKEATLTCNQSFSKNIYLTCLFYLYRPTSVHGLLLDNNKTHRFNLKVIAFWIIYTQMKRPEDCYLLIEETCDMNGRFVVRSLEVIRGAHSRREDFSQNIPLLRHYPRPASCHNDFCQLHETRGVLPQIWKLSVNVSWKLRQLIAPVPFGATVDPLSSRAELEAVGAHQRYQSPAPGETTRRLALFVSLNCGVSSFSAGLAYSMSARWVVSHCPLMSRALTADGNVILKRSWWRFWIIH